jgi:hypothetical protein
VESSIRAVGRSRGGRARKNHVVADSECWPIALMLSADQIVDCTAGELVLENMPKAFTLRGDKGFDSDAILARSRSEAQCPTSRPRPIGDGSHHSRTTTGTPP